MKFVNLRLEVFSQKKQNTMNFYQRICQKKLWGWFCVEETDYFSESKTVQTITIIYPKVKSISEILKMR